MPVRVGPQAQTLPRPGRPVAPNAGYAWVFRAISGPGTARYAPVLPMVRWMESLDSVAPQLSGPDFLT
jgi:hypothetical protein